MLARSAFRPTGPLLAWARWVRTSTAVGSRRGPPPRPLSVDEMASLLEPWRPGPRLAVAVSGGPDSMALAFLTAQWAQRTGRSVVAVTVDHALRPESGAEAATVSQRLAGLGLPSVVERVDWSSASNHAVLGLERMLGSEEDGEAEPEDLEDGAAGSGTPRIAHLQEQARTRRHAILQRVCQRHDVSDVLLGHHLDDQCETVLSRLARSSGIDGLGGIHPVVQLSTTLRLLHPLLPVPKDRLIATCEQAGIEYVRDPSNENLSFDRNRARQGMLAAMALDDEFRPEDVGSTAAFFQRMTALADQETSDALRRCVATDSASGTIFLDATHLLRLAKGDEILLRALQRVLAAAGGGHGDPGSFRGIRKLLSQIRSGWQGNRGSFGRCCIVRKPITVVHEDAASSPMASHSSAARAVTSPASTASLSPPATSSSGPPSSAEKSAELLLCVSPQVRGLADVPYALAVDPGSRRDPAVWGTPIRVGAEPLLFDRRLLVRVTRRDASDATPVASFPTCPAGGPQGSAGPALLVTGAAASLPPRASAPAPAPAPAPAARMGRAVLQGLQNTVERATRAEEFVLRVLGDREWQCFSQVYNVSLGALPAPNVKYAIPVLCHRFDVSNAVFLLSQLEALRLRSPAHHGINAGPVGPSHAVTNLGRSRRAFQLPGFTGDEVADFDDAGALRGAGFPSGSTVGASEDEARSWLLADVRLARRAMAAAIALSVVAVPYLGVTLDPSLAMDVRFAPPTPLLCGKQDGARVFGEDNVRGNANVARLFLGGVTRRVLRKSSANRARLRDLSERVSEFSAAPVGRAALDR